jgi:hypothetical protein
MSDVNVRLESLRASLAALRKDLPAVEWRTGQMLSAVAELADLVGQLAAAAGNKPAATERPAEDRSNTLQRLVYQACRAVKPGLDGVQRDAEMCRILRAWSVTERELKDLGYRAA